MTADVITLRMAARDSAEQFRNLSGTLTHWRSPARRGHGGGDR